MKSTLRYALLLAGATAFTVGLTMPALADNPSDHETWVTEHDTRADGRMDWTAKVKPAGSNNVMAATQRLPAPTTDQMPAAGNEPTSNAVTEPVVAPKPAPMRTASNEITTSKAMRSHAKSRRDRDAEERAITDQLNEQSLQNATR